MVPTPKQSPSPQKSPQIYSSKQKEQTDYKEHRKIDHEDSEEEEKSVKRRKLFYDTGNGDNKTEQKRSGMGKTKQKELMRKDLKDQKKQYKQWLATRATEKDRDG